jgi:alkanesulfonate monooxygenase SsuD/methylene tetrahydromethanopterin reductase-like flavin-dependent oxidoreductase (luciferase family)
MLAQGAERLGYTRVWASEHRGPAQSASPIPLAAFALARTSRIRIGTAGVMLRYHSPLKLAEDAFLLDHLSGGRFDLGTIGAGASDPVVDAALLDGRRDTEVDYTVKLSCLSNMLRRTGALAPAFRSSRPPPLWVCSASVNTAQIAGRCSAKFVYGEHLSRVHGLAESSKAVAAYRDAFAVSLGEEPECIISCYGSCEEDGVTAKRTWAAVTRSAENVQGGPSAPSFLGSPAECHEQLCALAEQYDVSEITVQCIAISVSARLAAYERLARAFDLPRSWPARENGPMSAGEH